jgi:hypothetical protein
MPTAQASVEASQPSRYLVCLCRHAMKPNHRLRDARGQVGHESPEVIDIEWTNSEAIVHLTWGICAIHAGEDTLTVRVEAPDQHNLSRLQALIAADLQRFGRRRALAMRWTQPHSSSAS